MHYHLTGLQRNVTGLLKMLQDVKKNYRKARKCRRRSQNVISQVLLPFLNKKTTNKTAKLLYPWLNYIYYWFFLLSGNFTMIAQVKSFLFIHTAYFNPHKTVNAF